MNEAFLKLAAAPRFKVYSPAALPAQARTRAAAAGALPRSGIELLTGHAIVSSQTSPSVSWLQAAREDLVALNEATRRPDQAAQYRATPASD